MQVVESEQRTFLGHPIGLYVLFFTEMWERFSYYGMRALLILYLVNYYKYTQTDASTVYKWYTALVYLTPLLGGYLADRFLGNKTAIVIGAILMAIGQFGLGTGEQSFLYIALGFLIVGNGFFKPNMSVQVGRLYAQNDPRRDGAYTIFYMGINIGAFFAPIVCGALRNTPGLGFHWGFRAAGFGMLLGLIIYLVGLPLIKELPEGAEYRGPQPKPGDEEAKKPKHVMTEKEAESARSAVPRFAAISPMLFVLIGVILVVGSPIIGWLQWVKWDNAISMIMAGGCAFFAAWILWQLSYAVRDRVLAIFVLFFFVVFFWGAFEQAGNAMNIWADQTTDRYVTKDPGEPSPYPMEFVAASEKGFGELVKDTFVNIFSVNPLSTESFQSINPAAIVLLAPLFAWLWTYLARRNISPSIAVKMATGVFLQGIAFALMIWSVQYESGQSTVQLKKLPPMIVAAEDGQVFFYDAPSLGQDEVLNRFLSGERTGKDMMIAHGGRMFFDRSQGELRMRGVFDANHRDRILRSAAPPDYLQFVWDMATKSRQAKAEAGLTGKVSFEVQLDKLPPGFDAKYLRGFNPEELRFDEESNTFYVGKELGDQDYKQLLVAGADPEFRSALNQLWVKATKFRVSPMWLVWFYILCTLGELCLSPVGLSMVSKLAPRRFATMLMGVWLLTSFFGNFTAGLAGEYWESLDPAEYFMFVAVAMFAAAFACYLAARKITQMMHGVE
jgi:proton-dependent oligopeptide transporter, POT family